MKTLNARRGGWSLLLASLIISLGGVPVAAQFGELPPGQVSHTEQGLTSELVLFMAFNPAPVKNQLPEGLRFRTLRESAARNASIAEYLRIHPERGDWARGYIEIMRADNYRVDGRRARFGKRDGMAVWYAYVERIVAGDMRLNRVKVLANVLALGSWIADAKLARYMRQKGFPVNAADIKFWRDSKGIYGRMKAPGLEIRGEYRSQGESEKVSLPTPAYVTVWTPRTVSRTFELLTGYGSTKQECRRADWDAKGTHPLVGAFHSRAQGVEGISAAEYQFGYVLHTALYQQK